MKWIILACCVAVVLGCHSDKDCTNMCKHDGNLLDGNCVHGVCHCDHAIIGKRDATTCDPACAEGCHCGHGICHCHKKRDPTQCDPACAEGCHCGHGICHCH